MLIPSHLIMRSPVNSSLSRRVNANSQLELQQDSVTGKLIKKGEC